MVCILLAFTIIALVYCKTNKKKAPVFLLIELLIIIIDIAIIFLSPARALRYEAEISWSFPSYQMLSIVERITIGITSTMAQFIARKNWLFLVLIFMLSYGVKNKENRTLTTFTTLFPMGVIFTIMCFPETVQKISQNLYNAFYYSAHADMPDFAPFTVLNCTSISAYLPLICSLLIIGCIVISLYVFFGKNKAALPILIFIAGFCSRMIMAFSPSIYESARRTYMFMYFGIIIVILMIYQEMKQTSERNVKNLRYYIMFGSILPIITTIVNIVMKRW